MFKVIASWLNTDFMPLDCGHDESLEQHFLLEKLLPEIGTVRDFRVKINQFFAGNQHYIASSDEIMRIIGKIEEGSQKDKKIEILFNAVINAISKTLHSDESPSPEKLSDMPSSIVLLFELAQQHQQLIIEKSTLYGLMQAKHWPKILEQNKGHNIALITPFLENLKERNDVEGVKRCLNTASSIEEYVYVAGQLKGLEPDEEEYDRICCIGLSISIKEERISMEDCCRHIDRLGNASKVWMIGKVENIRQVEIILQSLSEDEDEIDRNRHSLIINIGRIPLNNRFSDDILDCWEIFKLYGIVAPDFLSKSLMLANSADQLLGILKAYFECRSDDMPGSLSLNSINLLEKQVMRWIMHTKAPFKDILTVLNELKDSKLRPLKVQEIHIINAIKRAESSEDIMRLLAFMPIRENRAFVTKSIGECLNRIGEPRDSLSDEEAVERGARAIEILVCLNRGQIPDARLEIQHISQALKFCATTDQIMRMIALSPIEARKSRAWKVSIGEAINHLRVYTDEQLAGFWRNLIRVFGDNCTTGYWNSLQCQVLKRVRTPEFATKVLSAVYWSDIDESQAGMFEQAAIDSIHKLPYTESSFDTCMAMIAKYQLSAIKDSAYPKMMSLSLKHARSARQIQHCLDHINTRHPEEHRFILIHLSQCLNNAYKVKNSGLMALDILMKLQEYEWIPVEAYQDLLIQGISLMENSDQNRQLSDLIASRLIFGRARGVGTCLFTKAQASKQIESQLEQEASATARLAIIKGYVTSSTAYSWLPFDQDIVKVMAKYCNSGAYLEEIYSYCKALDMNLEDVVPLFKIANISSSFDDMIAFYTKMTSLWGVGSFEFCRGLVQKIDSKDHLKMFFESINEGDISEDQKQLIALDFRMGVSDPKWFRTALTEGGASFLMEYFYGDIDFFRVLTDRLFNDNHGVELFELCETYADGFHPRDHIVKVRSRDQLLKINCHDMTFPVVMWCVSKELDAIVSQKGQIDFDTIEIITGKGLHARKKPVFHLRDQVEGWLLDRIHTKRLWRGERVLEVCEVQDIDGHITLLIKNKEVVGRDPKRRRKGGSKAA